MLSYYLSLLESEHDQRLFTDLYQGTRVQIEKMVSSMLGQQDAEDALQNTYMQVIRHFDTVCAIAPEERPYWLRVVAKNEARMIMRGNQKTFSMEEEDTLADDMDTEDTITYTELVALFTRLPDKYRDVLELRFLLNYSGKEIAERLGISENLVNTRIFRGRAILQDIIIKEGFYER